MVWLTVKDTYGNVVCRLKAATNKGIHRTAWNLRYPSASPIDVDEEASYNNPSGIMAPPGTYTVSLSKQVDGVITELAGPVEFKVEQMYKGALQGTDPKETVAYFKDGEKLQQAVSAMYIKHGNAVKRVDALNKALQRAPVIPGNLDTQLHELRESLLNIDRKLYGNRSRSAIGEKDDLTIRTRLGVALSSSSSTYGPTPTHKRSLEIARAQFTELKSELEYIVNIKMPQVEKAIIEAGAPWVEGQDLPEE